MEHFNFAVPAIIMRDAFIDLGRRLQNNSQCVMLVERSEIDG